MSAYSVKPLRARSSSIVYVRLPSQSLKMPWYRAGWMIWLEGVSVRQRKLGMVLQGMSNSESMRDATSAVRSTGVAATHKVSLGPRILACLPYTGALQIHGMFCRPNTARREPMRSLSALWAIQSKPPCAKSAPTVWPGRTWGAMARMMCGCALAGAATKMTSASGITSAGLLDTRCRRPTSSPLCSQLEPAVTTRIVVSQSWGRLVSTLTLMCALDPMYPAAVCAPFPPPQIVTVSVRGAEDDI
mmetsp:Transcript_27600/g.88760  ORF Transcript_27600/g.88760 Transcript_27600/m.88760 type:complete len:245 (+) Transcript_27600:688-1422(+)